MPFWGFISKKNKDSHTAAKVKSLEEKVDRLSTDLKDAQNKILEISKLLNYTISSQKQLSLDMNIIYESITQVSESLQGAQAQDDEKYFKWRWVTGDDDDDLPN